MEKKSYIVAIDVGSSEVKVAVGTIADNEAVNVECIATEPCEGITAGVINNIQTVGKALRAARDKAEQMAGVAITDAYVSISSKAVRCARYTDHVFVEDVENCISQRDVMSLNERMHNVKAADGEIIMDLFPICYKNDMGMEMKVPVGSFSKQLTATYNFILCEERQVRDRFMNLFRDAGIRVKGMFASGTVVAESVVTTEEKEEGVAIVDIGSGITDLAIYHGGALCYMVSIPIGGDAIDSDIRHYASQIPLPAIEKLKRKYGSAKADMTTNVTINIQKGSRPIRSIQSFNLASIIEARMTDIAEYVVNEIREAGFAKKLPAGIVLTGGVANLPHIAELFQQVSGIETRVACAELGITSESFEQAASPNLTLAVSLLLRGAQEGATPVGVLQNVAKPEVKVATPAAKPVEKEAEEKPKTPTTINDRYKSQEEPAKQEGEGEVVNKLDDKDDIPEEPIPTRKGLFGRLADRLKTSFDKAFQNPDDEEEDDNDDY